MPSESQALRIAAIFIVATTSFLGTLVAPAAVAIARRRTKRAVQQDASAEEQQEKTLLLIQPVLRVLCALSTGIVMGTASLHLLPEAIVYMQDAVGQQHSRATWNCVNGSAVESPPREDESPVGPFPWAELIAVLTAIAMYIFEKEVFAALDRRQRRQMVAEMQASRDIEARRSLELLERDPKELSAGTSTADTTAIAVPSRPHSSATKKSPAGHGHSHGGGHDEPDEDEDPAIAALREQQRETGAVVYSHVVELALSIHSVILGLTVGLITHLPTVRALVIAVAIDQFSDGVAVGATLCESKSLTFCHRSFLRGFFAWTCSIGIAIGVGVESRGGSGDAMAQGILASMSAGMLLLLSMAGMLPGMVRPFPKIRVAQQAAEQAAASLASSPREPAAVTTDGDDGAAGATPRAVMGVRDDSAHGDSGRDTEAAKGHSAAEQDELATLLPSRWRWVLYGFMLFGYAVMAIIAKYGG